MKCTENTNKNEIENDGQTIRSMFITIPIIGKHKKQLTFDALDNNI